MRRWSSSRLIASSFLINMQRLQTMKGELFLLKGVKVRRTNKEQFPTVFLNKTYLLGKNSNYSAKLWNMPLGNIKRCSISVKGEVRNLTLQAKKPLQCFWTQGNSPQCRVIPRAFNNRHFQNVKQEKPCLLGVYIYFTYFIFFNSHDNPMK